MTSAPPPRLPGGAEEVPGAARGVLLHLFGLETRETNSAEAAPRVAEICRDDNERFGAVFRMRCLAYFEGMDGDAAPRGPCESPVGVPDRNGFQRRMKHLCRETCGLCSGGRAIERPGGAATESEANAAVEGSGFLLRLCDPPGRCPIRRATCPVRRAVDEYKHFTGLVYTVPESGMSPSDVGVFARAGTKLPPVRTIQTQSVLQEGTSSSVLSTTIVQRNFRSGLLEIFGGNRSLVAFPGWGPHWPGSQKTIHWPSYTTAFLADRGTCFWPLVPQLTHEETDTSFWMNEEPLLVDRALVSGGMVDGFWHAMIILNAWCQVREQRDVSFLVQSIYKDREKVPRFLYTWSDAMGIDSSRIIFHDRPVVVESNRLYAAPWEDVHADWSCLHGALRTNSNRSIALVYQRWEKKSKSRDIPAELHFKLVAALSDALGIPVETFNGTESFEETRQLFSSARIVIGPHGGGMANLIFCDASTPVVELLNPSLLRRPWQMYGGHSFSLPWWPVLVRSFDQENEIMRSVLVAKQAFLLSR